MHAGHLLRIRGSIVGALGVAHLKVGGASIPNRVETGKAQTRGWRWHALQAETANLNGHEGSPHGRYHLTQCTVGSAIRASAWKEGAFAGAFLLGVLSAKEEVG